MNPSHREQNGETEAPLSPRVARLKQRLLTAPYEICLARAQHFTHVYRQESGSHPALRNARALSRTLTKQKIFIYPDEHLAGSKTEKYLACPLPVERGDFLRVLQMELDILDKKQRPFRMSDDDKRLFLEEILPFWSGRSVRDEKVRNWQKMGIINTNPSLLERLRGWVDTTRFFSYIGSSNWKKIMGANTQADLSLRRLRNLFSLRYELSSDSPTPAMYCLDVQGHLCLGLDRALEYGMQELARQARQRLDMLDADTSRRSKKDVHPSRSQTTHPVAATEGDGSVAKESDKVRDSARAPSELESASAENRGEFGDFLPTASPEFLRAVIISLESAIAYSDRFAELAEAEARRATDPEEVRRLETIAAHCRRVPRKPPRTFHEALQAAWFTLLVGEIQFGAMDVFAVGRIDQFLYPYLRADLDAGRLSRSDAIALLQEFSLKLSANISPTPELGMESNAVLGNSQHCVTIGGVTPDGRDGTNELSMLILEAYEQMNGSVNQICVRLHEGSPPEFVRRAVSVFRRTNGIAFYNDDVIVPGLLADGMALQEARNYCVVGCVETCGQSNTHGCVAGHDLVLPTVLLLTLSDGALPPPTPGQARRFVEPWHQRKSPRLQQLVHAAKKLGNGATGQGHAAKKLGKEWGVTGVRTTEHASFEELLDAFRRQLSFQVSTLIRAIEGKDRAHRELLPVPYVSALMDGCIDSGTDITAGGAKYDFTTVVVRGMATLVDSLLAIKHFVYETRELTLQRFVEIVAGNFEGDEPLRRRIIREPAKFGTGNSVADELTLQIIRDIHRQVCRHRNIRGGRYRVALFSVGNHVIDGFFLGATPDGRLRGQPISNGVSPSNLVDTAGPLGPMKTIAKLPPEQVSSGVAFNLRFHPRFIETDKKLATFVAMLRTYFQAGGMQIQPNFISTETLRAAQDNPDEHRDLVVKVSGYSACFVDLGRSIQEDIITRIEYT